MEKRSRLQLHLTVHISRESWEIGERAEEEEGGRGKRGLPVKLTPRMMISTAVVRQSKNWMWLWKTPGFG